MIGLKSLYWGNHSSDSDFPSVAFCFKRKKKKKNNNNRSYKDPRSFRTFIVIIEPDIGSSKKSILYICTPIFSWFSFLAAPSPSYLTFFNLFFSLSFPFRKYFGWLHVSFSFPPLLSLCLSHLLIVNKKYGLDASNVSTYQKPSDPLSYNLTYQIFRFAKSVFFFLPFFCR